MANPGKPVCTAYRKESRNNAGRRGIPICSLKSTTMKKIVLSLIVLPGAALGTLYGQMQIERQLVSCSGAYVATGNVQLSASVGEVATQTFISGSFNLTQGMQQSNATVTDVIAPATSVDYRFYPNPTGGRAVLELDMPVAARLHFRVGDFTGRPIQQFSREVPAGLYTEPFDLTAQPPGIYWLSILDERGEQRTVIQLIRN